MNRATAEDVICQFPDLVGSMTTFDIIRAWKLLQVRQPGKSICRDTIEEAVNIWGGVVVFSKPMRKT
jgi:hypothetical protein